MIAEIVNSVDLPEPQHWPMSMERFGKTPYNKPLYRIVFAPSVKKIVGGKWPDGAVEYRLRKAYRKVGDEWILERWLSAAEFTRMTRERFEETTRDPQTGLFVSGPWPEKGVYFMCEDAPLASPGDGGIEKLIGWIEHGRNNHDPLANALAYTKQMVAEDAAWDAEALLKIGEARPSFGRRPTSFRGGVHKVKEYEFPKSAQQTGLPIGDNKFSTGVI